MRENISYKDAQGILLETVKTVGTCRIRLEDSIGMVLAEDVAALENVPPFSRSPYDGYAFRSEDTKHASKEQPAVLKIIDEVSAGNLPGKAVETGTAVKILTGAPIPAGADAVIMYEKTEYSDNEVRIFEPAAHGSNIVYAGEDVRVGQVLAKCGTKIDSGLAGTLSAQGIAAPKVYLRPRIGLIATGNEIIEVGNALPAGKIYNTNRYSINAVLGKNGYETEYFGIAGDSTEEIANRITRALEVCDAVLLTGGVSAGDYDLTPAAMELAGVQILVRGVEIKPGMACAYGVKDAKLVCGLSGNPVAALANLQLVVLPALKRLAGIKEALPHEISVTLADPFPKKSKKLRPVYGKLMLEDGIVKMRLSGVQGNAIVSSLIGCDVMALIPEGSGGLEAETKLKGFMI